MNPTGRAKLTAAMAISIFKLKRSPVFKPKAIASRYGVSEKSIRDIWNGRTWAKETKHLDPLRVANTRKKLGRPHGSKDRTKRLRTTGTVKKNRFTIDDQLHEWRIWFCNPTKPTDPFARDWQQAKSRIAAYDAMHNQK